MIPAYFRKIMLKPVVPPPLISSEGLVFSGSDRWLSIIFLVLITAAVYSPVVNQDFLNLDDGKHIAAIWRPTLDRAWAVISDYRLAYTRVSYYTPLHFLSLMADQAIVMAEKPEPWISKSTNIGYHVCNTLLVFGLLCMLRIGRREAFIASLMFAVHPVQVGTVAWIAERKNLLSALFYLSSLITFIKYCRTGRSVYFPAVLLLFICGLLSKPVVVTVPVIMAAWLLLCPEERPHGKGPYALIGSLMLLAALWGLYVVSTESSSQVVLPPWQYRPLIVAGAVWFYLSKLIFPYELVLVYPRWNVEDSVWIFLILFVALAVCVAALTVFRKRMNPLVPWGLIFFFVSILPVSGLVQFGYMQHAFVADHFLYIPMVGLAVVVATGVQFAFHRFRSTSAVTLVLLGSYAVVCIMGVLAVRQAWLWRHPAALWEATLKVNKTSFLVYTNYSAILLTNGEFDKALSMAQRAVEIEPRVATPYNHMGYIYLIREDKKRAEEMFYQSLRNNPQDSFPSIVLGRMLLEDRKYDAAIEFFNKQINKLPQSSELRTELGICLQEVGRLQEATEAFQAAITVDSSYFKPYICLGEIALSAGDRDRAIALLGQSLRLNVSAAACNMLGVAYAQQGLLNKALQEFSKAYQLDPNIKGVRDNIANAFMDIGNPHGAEEFCLRAEAAGTPCSSETLKRIKDTAP
jgi:protein O-mannosyl-transferase